MKKLFFAAGLLLVVMAVAHAQDTTAVRALTIDRKSVV